VTFMTITNVYSRSPALALALVTAGCVSLARGQTTPASGALHLTLADDSGSTVAGASIMIRKQPLLFKNAQAKTIPIPPGANVEAFVTSDSNGHASAPILDPGDYTVCVAVPPALGIVDPCTWTGVWKVTVASAQQSAPPAFVLRKGGVVRVHVTDAQHLLPKQDSIVMPLLSIGVRTAGNALIGMKTSEQITSVGRDYILTVPFDTPLRLWVFSRTLRFVDQSGGELLKGGNVAFTIPSGQTAKDFNLSIKLP
jgi:hypothetical protein